MIWLGDWPTSSTIRFYFPTYGGSNESITASGLAVTDIEVYKDSSMTQRASDNGYTLIDTDGLDIDGITGAHGFSIDTSDNSDAGFWAAGSQYTVIVNAFTVNAQTVILMYGFTLEVANGAIDILKDATFGLSAIEGLVDDLESRLTAARAGYLDNLNGHTAQTGDSFARLGAPAGASVSADIATVDGNVDTLLTRITSTLFSGITSLAEWLGLLAGKQAGNATALTEIKATGAGSGTFSETTDSLEAIRDTAPLGTAMRGTDSAALASVATEARLAELDAGNLPTDIADVPTVAEFNARTLAAAAYFDPAADTVTVGTNNDKTGYSLSAAAIQAIWDALTSALTTAGSVGKLIVDNINATISSRATPAQVNTEVDNALNTAIPGAPTAGSINERIAALDDDLGDGGRLDLLIDAIKAVTDALPDSGALTTIGNNISSILSDTGTDGVVLTAAERNAVADAIFGRSLGTEAYAADGAVPTLAQAVFMILQNIAEFSISGTTLTVKKLDGTSTAMTFTLDDADSPTSRTRTT